MNFFYNKRWWMFISCVLVCSWFYYLFFPDDFLQQDQGRTTFIKIVVGVIIGMLADKYFINPK